MIVHNHGAEEGEGLGCPETRLLGGQLMGQCILIAEIRAKIEQARLDNERFYRLLNEE